MREISTCFLWLLQVVGFICCVGRVTDVSSRVEPEVGSDRDSHQADRCERAQARQNNLNATITPSHDSADQTELSASRQLHSTFHIPLMRV